MVSCTFCDHEAETTLIVRKGSKLITGQASKTKIKIEKRVPVCLECSRDVERAKPDEKKPKEIEGQMNLYDFL